jgi:hypothetical protein
VNHSAQVIPELLFFFPTLVHFYNLIVYRLSIGFTVLLFFGLAGIFLLQLILEARVFWQSGLQCGSDMTGTN